MSRKGLVKKVGRFNCRYIRHESLIDFDDFVAEETSKNLSVKNLKVYNELLNDSNRMLSDELWFGSPVTSIKELEVHNEFQNLELLKTVEEEISGSLDEFLKMELINEAEIKKIAYNSFGLGIFSFDRAAMGLHKVKNTDGEIKIATSVKDVYAYFLKKLLPRQAVKIYISAGANANVHGKNMLYTGMSAVVLADFLQQKDYSVEINVIFDSQSRNSNFLQEVSVKKFTDSLDKNLIAVLSSDPKYFRFKGFKAIIAGYNNFGLTCPEGLGTIVPLDDIEEFLHSENTDGCTPIVLGQSYSLRDAKDGVIQIVNRLKRKENASGKSHN